MAYKHGDYIEINGTTYRVSLPDAWDEYPCMSCCFDYGGGKCNLPLTDCVLMDEGESIFDHLVFSETWD